MATCDVFMLISLSFGIVFLIFNIGKDIKNCKPDPKPTLAKQSLYGKKGTMANKEREELLKGLNEQRL